MYNAYPCLHCAYAGQLNTSTPSLPNGLSPVAKLTNHATDAGLDYVDTVATAEGIFYMSAFNNSISSLFCLSVCVILYNRC